LLGDIGATNARFALLANGVLGAVSTFEVAKFARFADVVAIYLRVRPGTSSGITKFSEHEAD
jgi:glucokinase